MSEGLGVSQYLLPLSFWTLLRESIVASLWFCHIRERMTRWACVSLVLFHPVWVCCVLFFTPDGSNQPLGATLRGHRGRQLRHDGAEAAGQSGEEVLPRRSTSLRDGTLERWLNCLYLLVCLCFRSDFYVTMVKWASPERLSVRWVNRAQNTSILSLCDVTTSGCVKVRGRRTDRPLCCSSKLHSGVYISFQTSRNTWWRRTSGSIGWWVTDKWKLSKKSRKRIKTFFFLFSCYFTFYCVYVHV